MTAATLQLNDINLTSQIACGFRLDLAVDWLFNKKQNAGSNDLFWGMASNWQRIKATLRTGLQRGEYTFKPLKTVQLPDGMLVSMWQPQDAVVIKALTKVITPLFNVNLYLSAATYLKDHGGLKQAVQKVKAKLKNNRFVCKTDIADYYASIKHDVLLNQLRLKIKDKRVTRLLHQIQGRVHVRHGEHRLIENKSIPRVCSLSPLSGAIYLLPLDKWARKKKIDYVRYMGVVVILTTTRHKLKQALKNLYQMTKELGLKLAPAKTWPVKPYPGRVSKGFNFLGYKISQNVIKITRGSLSRIITNRHRENAQGATQKRLVYYVKRWMSWATSGVSLIDAPLNLNKKICPSKTLRGYSFKLHKNEWSCCL